MRLVGLNPHNCPDRNMILYPIELHTQKDFPHKTGAVSKGLAPDQDQDLDVCMQHGQHRQQGSANRTLFSDLQLRAGTGMQKGMGVSGGANWSSELSRSSAWSQHQI